MDRVVFHKETRKWLGMVIRQRSYLVTRGESRKNQMLMINNISYLKQHLNWYSYDDDRKMAKFFLANTDKIESLLPGVGASAYQIRQDEFQTIKTNANDILNYGRQQTNQIGTILPERASQEFTKTGNQGLSS